MMTKRHWLDARSYSPKHGASRATGRLSLALLMAVWAAGLTLAAPPSRPHRTIADPRASDAVRFPAAQQPPAAGTIGDPGPSAITSFPLPVDRGRAWLEAHQAANGSWGSTYQFVDTATAVETLGTLDPCYASVTRGAAWLAAQPPSNYEYLARQVGALSYPSSYYAQSRAPALELLAAREPAETNSSLPNWPAGGWGVAAGYETDVFTTAVALLALERAGFGGGLRANGTALAGGATNVHVWTIPPDALKARIEITVSGSTVRLRMTQGRQPNQFDPYFSRRVGRT